MKFSEYPIIKLLFSIIIGILLSKAIALVSFQWYWVLPLLISLVLLAWKKSYFFKYHNRHFVGIIIISIFVIIGFLLERNNTSINQRSHFSQYLKYAKSSELRIIEPPQEKKNTTKIIVEVQAINNDSCTYKTIGKALIYLQKDTLSRQLQYGDIIAFNNALNLSEAAQNPDQFNYKSYLELQDIYYQSYARNSDWLLIKKATPSIIGLSLALRHKLIEVLQQNNIQSDELSVAAGMLLGVRDMLSPELRQAYAGAGAMHILCVSGLHVGIIFMILSWLLTFLSYTDKGKISKSIIIILIIWFYAMLTGFSPSVVRSATMFSFIIIGQSLKRHVNIIGSLSASAFVLLIYNPNLILDLGFQLSYSAVTAIVIIQQPIANLWVPKNSFINKAWQLVAVSIAAQIGTAPLSIYYFHQFPNFFILTNLIVIPAAYAIIMLGILVVATSFIPFVSSLIGMLLSSFLSLINFLITYIEQMDYAVTHNLYINNTILILSVLLILSTSVWILERKKKLIFVNLSLIVLILIATLYNYDVDDEFIIYKNRKNTYMAIYTGKEAWILCDSNIYNDHNIASFSVSGHELHKGIQTHHYHIINPSLKIKNSLFQINYPYMRLGNNIISFEQTYIDNEDSLPLYYIYNNYNNASNKPIDSNYQWIITENIPYWEIKKIIPKLDSLGVIYHQIKNDGAWALKF